MDKVEFKIFFSYLQKTWSVFGPKKDGIQKDGRPYVLVDRLNDFEELFLSQQLPFYPFKRFFVPEEESLFNYQNERLLEKIDANPEQQRKALFGVNILDLKSILLYDQVFEKDPKFQARRQNILVIGQGILPDVSQNIFEQTFEEDILEHLSFDIFLGAINREGGEIEEFAVFTGSAIGQKILSDFGYDDYIHIQFSGPIKEGKLDERMLKIKDKLENHHNQKIWDELGKRCIECGKCTIACPTCFCFRIDDFSSLDEGKGERTRCWDSCYYQEFSEVAGGAKFLESTAERIHFWYYHKFARIPEEFNFMGCVGCRRCAAVCPVGIDIAEVLKEIENS